MNASSSIGTAAVVPAIPGRPVPSAPAQEPGTRALRPATERERSEASQSAQAEAAKAAKQAEEEVSAEKLQEDLTKVDTASTTGLRFRVEQKSGRVVVEVVDSKTGDLVRQIPSEEALRIAQQLAEGSSGLVDDRV